jgi:hypothetical protein
MTLLSPLCSRSSAHCLSTIYSRLSVHYCPLFSAFCSMLSALCSLLSALCSLLSALCSLPHKCIPPFCSSSPAYCLLPSARKVSRAIGGSTLLFEYKLNILLTAHCSPQDVDELRPHLFEQGAYTTPSPPCIHSALPSLFGPFPPNPWPLTMSSPL